MDTLTISSKLFTLFTQEWNMRNFPAIGPIPLKTEEQTRASILFQERSAQGYASKGEAIVEAIRLALSVTPS